MNYKHWVTCLRVATVVLISGHSIFLQAQPTPTPAPTPTATPLAVKIDPNRMASFVAAKLKQIEAIGGSGKLLNPIFIKTFTTRLESLYRQTCASAEADIGRLSYFPFNQASINAYNQYTLMLAQNQVKCGRAFAGVLSSVGLLGMPMADYYKKNEAADAQLIENAKQKQIPNIPVGRPNNSPISNKVGTFIPIQDSDCPDPETLKQAVCGKCMDTVVDSDFQPYPCPAPSTTPKKTHMKTESWRHIPRQVAVENNGQKCVPYLIRHFSVNKEFASACELFCPPPGPSKLAELFFTFRSTLIRRPYGGGFDYKYQANFLNEMYDFPQMYMDPFYDLETKLNQLEPPADFPPRPPLPPGTMLVFQALHEEKQTINKSYPATCADPRFSKKYEKTRKEWWITE